MLMSLAGNVDAELLILIKEKAGNIIDIAKSGGVGIISALMFLWAILWMMFQVERVFNNVWGIRKIPRKIYKRFGFYFIILLLVPFVVVLFSTGIAYYSNFAKFLGLDLSELRFLPKFLGYVGFYAVTVLTLSAMYKFIPATKVTYRYALRSALIAGFVFVVFQYLYLETQVFVARLNAVYGVLAAIPLFLIWLNFSWQIIIYGAELTYGFQNVRSYGITIEEPRRRRRRERK
jgi:membrane protein